jgi:hypothetical protein
MATKKSQNNYPTKLEEVQKAKRELELLELHIIEKALKSSDPESFIEAKTYIKGIEERKNNDLRSFTYSPMTDYYTGQGFKYKAQGLNNDLLRNMANTPQIKAIINTRIEQAGNFNHATIDTQRPGWTIAKKRGLFDDNQDDFSSKEKKEIEGIIHFLENGGNNSFWDFDGWESFTRKLYEDSWGIDQGVFEVAVDRMGRPSSFDVYDGTTFYLADHGIRKEEDLKRLEAYMINGYLPKYVQVFGNSVYQEYYPWELCFGIRNANTSVKLNGYGLSENEVLIQVITWMLNSNQYNGNFFSQGSNPKGILNFKENVDPTKLESFKQAWGNTLSGVRNSHKLAAISGGDLEWINMQLSNRDMEFGKWSEFLTILSCAVFRIDPSEVGFHVEGGASPFGQDGQKERLSHSKEKGLEPFLKFWQKKFTKYLVSPLSGGKYEFMFTGLEPDDEEANLDRDIKVLSNGGMSIQDFFLKYSNKQLDVNKDMLLNAIFLQYKQLQQQGGQESNQAVDQESGEYNEEDYNTNPFEEYEEKSEADPFNKAMNIYLDKFVKDTNKGK